MKDKDFIRRLNEIRTEITALGHSYIKTKLPIKVDDIKQTLDPFTSIEIAITKSIKKLDDGLD